jgi:hypothetical protein
MDIWLVVIWLAKDDRHANRYLTDRL